MQILNHQQQMQQQMANEKMQRPPNMPNMPNTPNPNQPHQAMMAQSMADASAQPPQVQPNAAGVPGMPPVRKKIWSGVLEWFKKEKNTPADKVPQQVPCYVTAKEGDAEIQSSNWPQRLLMQLMPKQLVGNTGQQFLKESRSVAFHLSPCPSLDDLTHVMSSGFAGCVHFNQQTATSSCDIRVLILFYSVDKKAFLGFIPNDQVRIDFYKKRRRNGKKIIQFIR